MSLLIVSSLAILAFFTLILTFHISMRSAAGIYPRTWGKAVLNSLLFDRQPGAFVPIGAVYGLLLSATAFLLYVLSFLMTHKPYNSNPTLGYQIGSRLVNIVGFVAAWVGMGYCLNACTLAFRHRSWLRLSGLCGVAILGLILWFLHAFGIRGKWPPFVEMFQSFGG